MTTRIIEPHSPIAVHLVEAVDHLDDAIVSLKNAMVASDRPRLAGGLRSIAALLQYVSRETTLLLDREEADPCSTS